MANLRVYELAKQYNVDNKIVKQILLDNGVEVKSHMSSISEEAADIVRKELSKDSKTADSQGKKETPEKKQDKKPADKKADERSRRYSLHNE